MGRWGQGREKGQYQFAETARRVLRTNWCWPLFRPRKACLDSTGLYGMIGVSPGEPCHASNPLLSRRAGPPCCPLRILPGLLLAEDQPQAGQRDSRNMVSAETGLPDGFDPGTRNKSGGIDLPPGSGVKWVARLGNASYGSAVVAGGRVFVGTNNEAPRDPRMQDDRGVLMCFDEKTRRAALATLPPQAHQDQVGRLAIHRDHLAADRRRRPRVPRQQPRRGAVPRRPRHAAAATAGRSPTKAGSWRTRAKNRSLRAPRTPTSSGSTTCRPNWASRRTTVRTARSSSTAICSTCVLPRASTGRTTTCRIPRPRR